MKFLSIVFLMSLLFVIGCIQAKRLPRSNSKEGSASEETEETTKTEDSIEKNTKTEESNEETTKTEESNEDTTKTKESKEETTKTEEGL